MGVCVFGFETALYILRRSGDRILQRARTEIDLLEATGGLRDISSTKWEDWLPEEGPVHLMAGSPAQHRASAHVVVHAYPSLKNACPVINLGEGFFVVAPEVLFLQMTNLPSEVARVFLGCELCGYYGFLRDRLIYREPLTTTEKIGAFLYEHPGMRGSERARKALPKIIEGSASPAETELALRLSLPVHVGGRGLEKPLLNHTLSLSKKAASAYGRDTITPDLFWERASLAIEYDSDKHHVGSDRIARDARRRIAYEASGYHVITVTSEQLCSPADFDELVRMIERATGKRRVNPTPQQRRKRSELANEVHRLATRPYLLERGLNS